LVVIGNFDGVHRGHRAVIETALSLARAQGLQPLVLTFDPHPAAVLGHGTRPVLTTLERKVELLLRLGPDLGVVIEPFTLALSQQTPTEFVGQILLERLRAKVVIVGENFRFGHRRAGDLAALVDLGRSLGFDAHAEPLVGDAEGLFSSTRARQALESGDLARLQRCLGRPHSLAGRVVRGAARGRTIGVPTANLGGVQEALPPYGVYAGLIDRRDPSGRWSALGIGVANLGVRPTVQAGFSVEIHLLDFEGDLYDAELRLHLIEKVRDEERFADLQALKAQIAMDIATSRARLAPIRPDPEANGAWG
jgi:riboflavin kinase/FMN adenylyltransferase